jgi:hypothetical protein
MTVTDPPEPRYISAVFVLEVVALFREENVSSLQNWVLMDSS